MLKARKAGFDFLDFEETEWFLSAAVEHAPEWHPYLVVATRTGLRVGEMVALRWREDIDLERGRLRVQQHTEHTDQAQGGAARSQHMHGTGKMPVSKSQPPAPLDG